MTESDTFHFDHYLLPHETHLQHISVWNRDRFSYFRSGGGDKYLGVLLPALARTWWQRPERPRKMFKKICLVGKYVPVLLEMLIIPTFKYLFVVYVLVFFLPFHMWSRAAFLLTRLWIARTILISRPTTQKKHWVMALY